MESEVELVARAALLDAGFPFVQVEPRLPELRNLRPDLLAWAPDGAGDLVPWAVVEVKHRADDADRSLAVFGRYRDLVNTVEHYVYLDDGAWFRADDGLLSMERIEAPEPPRFEGTGILTDVPLVTSLLRASLERAAQERGAGAKDSAAVATTLRDAFARGIELAPGDFARVQYETFFRASRRLVRNLGERYGTGVLDGVGPVLGDAMALLAGKKLGGRVEDPFAGAGTLLWSVADRAVDLGAEVSLSGREPSDGARAVASAIADSSPFPAQFESADGFIPSLSDVDLVVSMPPLGVRLPAGDLPGELLDGSRPRPNDTEVAIVDTVLRGLAPGGRAVLLVTNAFTSRASYEAYRQFVASHFRVAALIGLEGALKPVTQIPTVLMVIDRAEPSETFVARLVSDWESQLSPGGAALEAALEHIDGPAGA
jgi:hypothetical protein